MKIPLLCGACIAMIVTASAGFAAWPSADLAGHWRFDAVASDRAPDLSSRGRPLRIESAAFSAENGMARSLRCDGFETAAVLEETTPLEFSQALTLAVWVRPERPRRYDPVAGRPNSNPAWTTPTVGLYLDDGHPVFGLFQKAKTLLEGPRRLGDADVEFGGGYGGRETACTLGKRAARGGDKTDHPGACLRGDPLVRGTFCHETFPWAHRRTRRMDPRAVPR